MNYPFEKHKLDRARIIKAIDKIEKDISDMQQTKLYLLRELKSFPANQPSQVNSGKKK